MGPGPPIQKTKNSQGPPGCNLFIFHIPNDMTNRDLFTYFQPFGNVISARIMVDRETGRSRGFGTYVCFCFVFVVFFWLCLSCFVVFCSCWVCAPQLARV